MSGLHVAAIERQRLAGPLSVDVPAGFVTGLIGANGAGKTTLLRALAGLTSGPGEIMLGDRSLTTIGRDERARRVAYMPATREVDWPLTAQDVVALGLRGRAPGAVEQAMERTRTADFAARRVDRLSTGERARVLIARVIVAAPDVLLLDEPMANLDPLHRIDIEVLLRQEARRGAAVLIAIHDLDHAVRLCDRLVLMHRGGVLASGCADAVLNDANIARAFGIQRFEDGWRACDPARPAL